ncbi:MAG: sugar transferase [Devosia sp.]
MSAGLLYRIGGWPGEAGRGENEPGLASGLRLRWSDGMPVRPAMTLGRRIALEVKRAGDFIVSLAALIVLLPLLLFVAAAIKFSSKGPVFFRQTRIGLDGKPFTIFKFRSMYLDKCDAPGSLQAVAGDERVTPIGRFIRKTSIDELPQLLNVFFGEMSLVGPRPYVPDMLAAGRRYDEIVPYFSMRHEIRPGLTGWAQANGYRGPTMIEELAIRRVEHDIAYLQNFSLMLDLEIVLKTLRRELTGGSGV